MRWKGEQNGIQAESVWSLKEALEVLWEISKFRSKRSWGCGKKEVFLSVTWTEVYCIWLTKNGLSPEFLCCGIWSAPYTYTHMHTYLFLPLVWCHPNKPTLWTSQVGHPLRRNWLHRGRNVDLCSVTGMGTSYLISGRRQGRFVLLKVSFSSDFFVVEELKMRGKLKCKILLITHPNYS